MCVSVTNFYFRPVFYLFLQLPTVDMFLFLENSRYSDVFQQ